MMPLAMDSGASFTTTTMGSRGHRPDGVDCWWCGRYGWSHDPESPLPRETVVATNWQEVYEYVRSMVPLAVTVAPSPSTPSTTTTTKMENDKHVVEDLIEVRA